jgi:predicted MPP superfamily phosphohydrolase
VNAFSAAVGACTALGAYALVEPYRFRLNRLTLAVAGPAPVTLLHVSDTHLTAHRRKLVDWLRGLPEQIGIAPDIVVITGDLIEDDSGIDPVLWALEGLDAGIGRFYVLGSHDYYQSRFQAYTKYFTGRRPLGAPRAATHALESGLQSRGWLPLTNETRFAQTPYGRIRLTGVDDPYIGRDKTDHITRTEEDALAIGLVHAPDVVSEFALAGFDLVLAGHTHGGQVRVPGVGAVVTNCSLPAALAGGAHRIGSCWLHVSPGLGTGRFTPVRFGCPPEATLLELLPADS